MIPPLTVGYMVACALERGEECPADTADVIRAALLGVEPCVFAPLRPERRCHRAGPPAGVERRQVRVDP